MNYNYIVVLVLIKKYLHLQIQRKGSMNWVYFGFLISQQDVNKNGWHFSVQVLISPQVSKSFPWKILLIVLHFHFINTIKSSCCLTNFDSSNKVSFCPEWNRLSVYNWEFDNDEDLCNDSRLFSGLKILPNGSALTYCTFRFSFCLISSFPTALMRESDSLWPFFAAFSNQTNAFSRFLLTPTR